jgi:hypothetical protein
VTIEPGLMVVHALLSSGKEVVKTNQQKCGVFYFNLFGVPRLSTNQKIKSLNTNN